MARIEYADPGDLPDDLRGWYERLPPDPRMFLALAQASSTAGLVLDLGMALRRDAALPTRLVELVAATVTRITGSDYLRRRHVPSTDLLTTEEREAALRGDGRPSSFDERDRAVLRFAEAIAAGPRVDDETFAAVRRHLSDQELVELVQVHGYYWMLSRIATVLDVDADA